MIVLPQHHMSLLGREIMYLMSSQIFPIHTGACPDGSVVYKALPLNASYLSSLGPALVAEWTKALPLC